MNDDLESLIRTTIEESCKMGLSDRVIGQIAENVERYYIFKDINDSLDRSNEKIILLHQILDDGFKKLDEMKKRM
jgi:hypothetical protein